MAFIFVFAGEALTALALVPTFFDGDGPRRLWRVLWICCVVACMLCVVMCKGIFGVDYSVVLFVGLLRGSFFVWPWWFHLWLFWSAHNIKDSWFLVFPNPQRSSSLLWLWLLQQLLSPFVQIFPYHNTHLPVVSLVCC